MGEPTSRRTRRRADELEIEEYCDKRSMHDFPHAMPLSPPSRNVDMVNSLLTGCSAGSLACRPNSAAIRMPEHGKDE